MNTENKFNSEETEREDEQKIEEGFSQMEMLYRSRCIQPPIGSNVVVREIEKEE